MSTGNLDLVGLRQSMSQEAFAQRNQTYIELQQFLDEEFVSKAGDPENTIFVPQGRSYKISGGMLRKATELMTSCYRDGSVMHYAETQKELSGVMVDFDINTTMKKPQVTDDMIRTLCEIVYDTTMTVISGPIDPYDDHIAVLKAADVREKINGKDIYYRESIHILIPGCRIRRDAKRALMDQLRKSNVESIFSFELFNRDPVVDAGSASVPVFFLGSCKLSDGKQPDPLYKLFSVKYNPQSIKKVILTEIPEVKYGEWNLCLELSINHTGDHIKSREFPTHQQYVSARQLELGEHISQHSESSILAVNDVNAKMLMNLVGILDKSRADNYNDWNRVIFCLACQGESYKAIAEQFSARSEKHRPEIFEQKWAECMRQANVEMISEGMIYSMAKRDNPDRYDAIIKNNAYGNIIKAMFAPGRIGNLGQYTVAMLLAGMLGDKYKCTMLKGDKKNVWLEFVTPGDHHEVGQIYKYRIVSYPSTMDVYISSVFMGLVSKFYQDIENEVRNKNGLHKASKVEFYKDMLKQIANTMKTLESATFKNGVIQQASHLPQFQRPQLANMIDKVAYCLGVGNGVLHLGKSGSRELPHLIDYYHDLPITQYTHTPFEWYNPNCPVTRELEDKIIRDLFPKDEQDAYEFVMIMHAMALDGYTKPPYLMILQGEGSNGKSCLRTLMQNALGMFVRTQGRQLITQPIDTSQNVSSAVADLHGCHCIYLEEFAKQDALNDASLKMLLGGTLTAAKKFKDHIQFEMTAVMFALMNCVLHINETDAGTWRRILFYKMKMLYKFENDRNDPYDEKNPYHRIRRDDIINEYIKRPEVGKAFLSILVKWYVIFQVKYKGEINRVPRPSIDRETLEYRNSQDHLNRWICNRLVATPKSKVFTVDAASAYANWCRDYLDVKSSDRNKLDMIKQIENNNLLAKLGCIIDNPIGNGKMIFGYRIIDEGESIADGEKTIGMIVGSGDVDEKPFESADHKLTIQEWFRINTGK